MKTKRKPKPSSLTLLDRKMELERYVLNHSAQHFEEALLRYQKADAMLAARKEKV